MISFQDINSPCENRRNPQILPFQSRLKEILAYNNTSQDRADSYF